MSLKGFHLVFITLATLISLGFCLWAFVGAQETQVSVFLYVCGVMSGVLGVVLGVYGIWFAKKTLKTV